MDTEKNQINHENVWRKSNFKNGLNWWWFAYHFRKRNGTSGSCKNNKECTYQEVEEVKQEQGTAITSPLVGTYYQASGTNQEPFVKVGQHIQEGDTVCIIEAMKVMNEIKATVSGTVLSINVSDGETVEYDQVLMMIG